MITKWAEDEGYRVVPYGEGRALRWDVEDCECAVLIHEIDGDLPAAAADTFSILVFYDVKENAPIDIMEEADAIATVLGFAYALKTAKEMAGT